MSHFQLILNFITNPDRPKPLIEAARLIEDKGNLEAASCLRAAINELFNKTNFDSERSGQNRENSEIS